MSLLLFIAVLCIVSPQHLVEGEIVPLGIHGSPEYVDIIKNGPRWQSHNGGNFSVDKEGWPNNDFTWVFDYRRNKPWEGPNFNGQNEDIHGTYLLSFSGQATLNSDGSEAGFIISFQNQVYNPTTQTTTVSVVIAPGHWLWVLNFVNTQRPGKEKGTGLTNIHFLLPGYSLSKTPLFTSRFVSVVKGLKSATFRSFDTGINSYNIWNGKELVVNKWSDRSLPTDAYWPLPSRNGGPISGLAMPWEIFMQISIQTNTPGWYNLPVGVDDDYVLNLAKLLKDGNTFTPPLPAGQPFYVEYSNEVWNWGFSQSIYNRVLANQEKVNNLQRYVERTFQISAIFRKVFGDSAMGTTVRFVCMWQYGNWNNMQETLLWAQQKFGHPVDYYIWGIGEAPYLNSDENGNVPYPELDTGAVDRIIDSMYTNAGERRRNFAAWMNVATFFKIHEVGYESGPSLIGGVESDVNRSPRMKDLIYRYYMENWFALGGDTVNYFALGPGAPSVFGDWYLFEHWNNYSTYPKYEGFMAVSGQQRPPLTLGYVLPSKAGEKVTIDASQFDATVAPGQRVALCAAGCWPYPSILNYLLRISSKATFDVILSGSSQTSASVSIWFDNQPLTTTKLPTAGGNFSFSLNNVEPGLHTLALAGNGTGSTVLETGAGIVITNTNGDGSNPSVPSAPLNLRGTADSSQVMLVWEPVTTATQYNILRSQTSGSGYKAVGKSTTNSYTDKGLNNDELYYYVVTASSSVGQSALSPQLPLRPVGKPSPSGPLSLTITTGLEDGNSFAPLGQAFLTWKKIPDVITYTIHRDTKTELNTQSADATCYYDSGLTPGGTYTYNVTAKGLKGSISAAQTVKIPTSSRPGNPTGLSVQVSQGDAHLKWLQPMWSFPELGELFRIERGQSSSGPWTTIANESTNNFVDMAVGSNKYCYRVWALNGHNGVSVSPTNTVCI